MEDRQFLCNGRTGGGEVVERRTAISLELETRRRGGFCVLFLQSGVVATSFLPSPLFSPYTLCLCVAVLTTAEGLIRNETHQGKKRRRGRQGDL